MLKLHLLRKPNRQASFRQWVGGLFNCPFTGMSSFDQWFIHAQLPGKQVVRCSISASCVTCFRAEFIAEMARQRISPSGINCDWLMGDMLIGDTSPAKKQQMCNEAFSIKCCPQNNDEETQLEMMHTALQSLYSAEWEASNLFQPTSLFQNLDMVIFGTGEMYTVQIYFLKGCNRQSQKNAYKSSFKVAKPYIWTF